MVFRRDPIAESETLKNVEVWDTDLKAKGALSALEIEVTAINGATSNLNNHIHHLVKKIEVVDGSKKFHSVTGVQEQGLNWIALRKIPEVHMDETINVTQIGKFLVMFGRKIGDLEYFLDLDKLSNPKLQVDFNIAEVRAVGADAFVDGSARITVKGIVDQEKAALAQKGYLRAIEQYKWTSAASGDEKIELPVDYPYRLLMLRAYRQNSDPLGCLSKIKLAFDSPKYEYLEEYSGALMRAIHGQLGLPGDVTKWVYGLNGDTPEWPCMRNSAARFSVDGGLRRFISLPNFWKGYVAYGLWDHTGVAIAARETHEIALLTWMYQNCLAIPFGNPLLEGEFFPAPNYKKSTLTVTQGSATHAASVVLEEVATQ